MKNKLSLNKNNNMNKCKIIDTQNKEQENNREREPNQRWVLWDQQNWQTFKLELLRKKETRPNDWKQKWKLDNTTNSTGIKIIIKEYLYYNKLDNLHEMDKFLQRHKQNWLKK